MPNDTVPAAAAGLPNARLSRRHALCGIAAAVTVTPALAAPSPDAELLRLGAEFDQAYAEWLPLWREERKLHALWLDEVKARGLTFRNTEQAEIDAIGERIGVDAAGDATDAPLGRLTALSIAIKAHPASTLAGLAVKARVARYNGMSPFDIEETPVEDRDYDVAALLDFFAEVEALARVSA